jgi:hypothetical protein
MKIPRMHMPPMPGMMMPMPGMGMPPGMSHHQFPGMQQFVPASMPYPGFLIKLCDNDRDCGCGKGNNLLFILA